MKIITEDINTFDADDNYDRIMSIEMFEHTKNTKKLMNRINNWLKSEGSFFMHVFAHKRTHITLTLTKKCLDGKILFHRRDDAKPRFIQRLAV